MKYLSLILLLLPLSSCLDDELAFTVEASPVKVDVTQLEADAGTVAYQATFTELDKSGILDQSVGIVATPVPNLQLQVYSQTQDLIETLTTDELGQVTLTVPVDRLDAVTRLEWAGTFDDRAFRILTDL